jgi:hypothetical protein
MVLYAAEFRGFPFLKVPTVSGAHTIPQVMAEG